MRASWKHATYVDADAYVILSTVRWLAGMVYAYVYIYIHTDGSVFPGNKINFRKWGSDVPCIHSSSSGSVL